MLSRVYKNYQGIVVLWRDQCEASCGVNNEVEAIALNRHPAIAVNDDEVMSIPYTPRTNGKAERFIQTAMKEWAYARTYQSSDERAADFPAWIHMYNWHRPHAALGAKPPISRLRMDSDNLLMHHIRALARDHRCHWLERPTTASRCAAMRVASSHRAGGSWLDARQWSLWRRPPSAGANPPDRPSKPRGAACLDGPDAAAGAVAAFWPRRSGVDIRAGKCARIRGGATRQQRSQARQPVDSRARRIVGARRKGSALVCKATLAERQARLRALWF